MYTNILLWLVLVAITILFAWLGRRAWRSRNVFLKWGGLILSGLLSLVLGTVTILALIG